MNSLFPNKPMPLTTLKTNLPLSAEPSRKAYNWVNLAPKNFDSNTGMQPAQERRRTSLKEQSILEAAFRDNSLPDKHALKELSERLSMPVRAVQIWFQNKRQSNRRKETQQVNNSTGKMEVTYQEVKLEMKVVIQETKTNVVHQKTLETSQNSQQEVVNAINQEAKLVSQETSSKPTHSAMGARYTKSRDIKHVANKTPKSSSHIKRDRDLHINSTVITPTKRDRKKDGKSKRNSEPLPIEDEEPSRKRQRASTQTQTPPPSPLPSLSPPKGKRGLSEPPTEEEPSYKRQRASTLVLPTPPPPPPNGNRKRPNKVLTSIDDDDSEKENIAPYGPIHRPKRQRISRSWYMPMTILNEATWYPDSSDTIPDPADAAQIVVRDTPHETTNMPPLETLTPPVTRDTLEENISKAAETPTENEILKETVEENDMSGFGALILLAETAAKQEEIAGVDSLELSETVAKEEKISELELELLSEVVAKPEVISRLDSLRLLETKKEISGPEPLKVLLETVAKQDEISGPELLLEATAKQEISGPNLLELSETARHVR